MNNASENLDHKAIYEQAYAAAIEAGRGAGMSPAAIIADAKRVAALEVSMRTGGMRIRYRGGRNRHHGKRPNGTTGPWQPPEGFDELDRAAIEWACKRKNIDVEEYGTGSHPAAHTRWLVWSVLLNFVGQAVLARQYGVTQEAVVYARRKVSEIDKLAAKRFAEGLKR